METSQPLYSNVWQFLPLKKKVLLVLQVQFLVFQFVPHFLLPCHWILQRGVFFTHSYQVFMHTDNIPVSCLFSRLSSPRAKEQHKEGRLRAHDIRNSSGTDNFEQIRVKYCVLSLEKKHRNHDPVGREVKVASRYF